MERLIKALDTFKDKKVMVIGDIMLDQYLYGSTERISPEAPVPVIKFKRQDNVPGGAGNAAKNLISLGAQVYLVGLVGNDQNRELLIESLKHERINTDGLVIDISRPTIIKQRIVSGNFFQLLRVDYEDSRNVSGDVQESIVSYITNKASDVDIVLVSDYGKGLINKSIVDSAMTLFRQKNIPVIVDSKHNMNLFTGATLMTPNMKEAKRFAGTEGSVEEVGKFLVDKYNSNFLITRGSEGIALFERNGDTSYFSSKKKLVVHDVTGAGDSVAAVSALCLASGLDFKETANIANITGRIVVQKPGTSTLTVAELKEVLMISQINMSRKKVDKVWGSEDWIVNYEQSNYCGKRLILNKGYQCSIHYHKIKSEVFYINKGLVLMQAYGKEKLMTPGDSLLIEPGTKHRFIGLSDAEIIEFSSHHKEEDSYRDEPSGKIDDVTFNSYMERYAEEMKK